MTFLQAMVTARSAPQRGIFDEPSVQAPEESPRALPWWAFLLSLILTSVPVLVSSGLPSWDYPMHATRASIIVRQALPLFRDAFQYKLVPLPNLAVDLVVPLFSTVMPISLANKLFVLLALLLQATGAAALVVAVHKRLTPVSLLIPLACYNIILGWGFTGYLFSIGIAMWGFAVYVMLRQKSLPLRATVLGLFAIATYFGHLAAFGLMLASIAIFEVVSLLRTRPRQWRELRSGAAALFLSAIVPGLVHVFLSPVGQSVGTRYAPPIYWVTDLLMTLNPYRTTGFSVLTIALVAGLLFVLVRKVVKVDGVLGWSSLCLLGVYLLTPHEVYGSWYANTRLIPWVALVFLASLRVRRPGPATAKWVGACCLGLLVAQTGLILNLWLPWDAAMLDLMAAVRKAPPGTMFVPLEQMGPRQAVQSPVQRIKRAAWQDDPDWHPPTYHVVDEVALQGEYLPIELTLLPGKQPLEFNAKYWNLFLEFNSSYWNHIAPVDEASYWSYTEQDRRELMPNLAFAPLHVNSRTLPNIRRLLTSADGEYRAIRRTSGVYPNAGIYVVYIHRWSTCPTNPLPDMLREVHVGRLYNVYELRRTSVG